MHCTLCGVETPPGADLCPACEATRSSIASPPGASAQATTLHSKEATPPGLTPGSSFGPRYLIIESIGGGGMGRVYKALDRQLGRTVALKLVRSDLAEREDALRRFRQELMLAQDVTHPNVCRVYDLGDIGGVPYISMEYVDGQSLADLICSMSRLSPHQTATLGRQICAGLQAIHEKQIIHRDLKPGNVMVNRSGQARIMDFGVAHRPGEDKITKTGMVVGTMLYAAPEYLRGAPPDARCDVFSLGLLLFEMLTGKHAPGDEGTLPLALRERFEECPPPSQYAPEVPAALDDVVLKCLERNPAKRFQSAREVDEALAACQKKDEASAFTAPIRRVTTALFHPGRRASRTRRRVMALAVAALVMIAAAVGLKQYLTSGPSRDAPASIALLPLKYIGDPKNSHFGSLLPILISHDLEANERISVAPFAASQSFAPETDPKKVAVQLDVDSILHGQIRVREGDFTVKIKLVRASAKEALLSKVLTGQIGELTTQTHGLSNEVVKALGVKLKEDHPLPLSRDPKALEHYARGRAFLDEWKETKTPQKAADEFRQAIEIDNDFAEAHAYLAIALWTQYQDESRDPELIAQALKAAEKVIEEKPSLPEAHLAIGVLRLARGDSIEAAASFEEARRLSPADDTVFRRIAQAYSALGRQEEALRMFEAAIKLRDNFWLNHNALGVFQLRRGNTREAAFRFDKAIKLNPDNHLIWTNLAAALILSGDMQEAEYVLRTAIKMRSSASSRNNLGYVLYALGRFQESADQYIKAMDLGMNNLIVNMSLGDSYRQLGKATDASKAYDRCIDLGEAQLRLNTQDDETRSILSICYAGNRRCTASKKLIHRLNDDIDLKPIVHYYLSISNSICGDRNRAIMHTTRAIKKGIIADIHFNPDLKILLSDSRVSTLLDKPTRP